jgi:hypothetical protein
MTLGCPSLADDTIHARMVCENIFDNYHFLWSNVEKWRTNRYDILVIYFSINRYIIGPHVASLGCMPSA